MRLSRGDFEMSATLGNLSIDKFQIIMHKYNKAVLILIALVLILVGKGCMRRSTNEKRYQYKGKALALTFIYTRCPQPDQCTLMSNNFAAIDRELQKLPDVYSQTHLLSITF